MKKLLVLMAIAIIMATGVFAATSVDTTDGTMPNSEAAKINVTLGLGGGEGSRIYETGFTSTAVTTSSPTATPLGEENFALTINTTDWTAANAANTLYAYWVILSNQKVNVSLSIPAEGLTASNVDNGTIEWTNVKLTPASNSESVNTTTFLGGTTAKTISGDFSELNNPIVIATHDGTGEEADVQSVGSVGLEFQVSNLANVEPDTYSAAITLEVKTV